MVSALFRAAEAGDLGRVKETLVEQGVDLEIKDHTGTTPLIAAVKGSHVEVVKELLTAGADPLNPSSSGPPSMHTTLPEILSLLPPLPSSQVNPITQAPPPPMHYPSAPFYPPSDMYSPPNSGDMLYPLNGANNGVYFGNGAGTGGAGGFIPYGSGGMNGFIPGMGLPPHMMNAPHMMGYGMGGFIPGHGMPMMDPQMQQVPPQHLQQQQQPGSDEKGDNSGVDGGAGTIPPPDISKNIPCKFYPGCKYGNQCAFSHPAPQPNVPVAMQQPMFNRSPSIMYPPYESSSPVYNPYSHHPHGQPSFYPMNPYGYPHPSPPPPIPMNAAPPPPPLMHNMANPPPPTMFSSRGGPPPMDYDGDNAFVVVPPVNQVPPVFAPAPAPASAPLPPSAPSAAPPAPLQPSAAFAPSFVPQQTAATATATSTSPSTSPSSPASRETNAPGPGAASPAENQQQQQQQHPTSSSSSTTKAPFPFPPRVGGKFGPFHHGPNGPNGFNKKWIGGGGRHQGPSTKWVGGNAPPCSFFQAGACRNNDMCRFPHLLADGTDCRLPGVIDGSIPSAPISAVNGKHGPARTPFAPNFPASTKTLQNNAAMKISQSSAEVPADNLSLSQLSLESSAPNGSVPDKASSAVDDAAATSASLTTSLSSGSAAPAAPSSAPTHIAAPSPNSNAHSSARHTTMVQGARSQPTTRVGSPAASGGAGNHYPNHFLPQRNPRSASANAFGGRTPIAAANSANGSNVAASMTTPTSGAPTHVQSSGSQHQKVPSSADFPALGSSTGSLKDLSGSAVIVNGNGKTAAQILSAPAPEKAKTGAVSANGKKQPTAPKTVAPTAPVIPAPQGDDKETTGASDDSFSFTDKSSESGEDGVIVKSAKSVPSAPNGGPSPGPAKRNLVSFAHMVGGVKG
ncbi:Integral membrane ankyrin-repeat protein Kidins220 (protein kinase D substrate) [Phaffia rhodozyma]|uniref:Integral membrane ankyrin-repeat protein Kidins220 (Protein kinase D substrate) n=1 Tax=Phaffia rhodozyma TaxID=264483 RepID=A0A0F7ST31_PHARH|nr:Integral membrane ankyrin-repeat protein Kidins220 (protein kinase D substrate) [Phaffia rhodozyma]